jgi:porphobilinogen synthase
MLQRVSLRRSDIIVPVFVCGGAGVNKPVASMPGVAQMSVDVASDWLGKLSQSGFGAYLAFGVIERTKKDASGSESLNPSNVVCDLIRTTKNSKNPMAAITDLCLCEYTDHGHCGPLMPDGSTVDNDATLTLLAKQAVNHANAGADVIAPSGMMDNMVRAIRAGLDDADYIDVPILSYAVKYASAFYGPFRDAADSAPAHGDRKCYQMDPARGLDEALHEVDLDLQQGADMVMVKPAGAYLDVIRSVRDRVKVPVVAYQVSGEYAMIQAAGANGWIDRDRVIIESLTSIKRAGADLIISYFAPDLIRLLD